MVKRYGEHKNAFLDIWYSWSPQTYQDAWVHCDADGQDMIRWLRETNWDLFQRICSVISDPEKI